MAKSTISMAIFNSKLFVYQRVQLATQIRIVDVVNTNNDQRMCDITGLKFWPIPSWLIPNTPQKWRYCAI